MSQKIAVAIVHGVGKQSADFAEGMKKELKERFAKLLEGRAKPTELAFQPVFWAEVLQKTENELWRRLRSGKLRYRALREFMVDFAADAIAYQPSPKESEIYDEVHAVFAQALSDLADTAGPRAPLCVIAHSLGTVIASNYFYDLDPDRRRRLVPDSVRKVLGRDTTPLERGETFALFYTLGSPIAIWSLRYKDFGRPIDVPASKLPQHHLNLRGEWVNFYDPDDIIAYPLKSLNDVYAKVVTQDERVNVGGILTSWNPAAHMGYWTDNDVTKPIAASLAETWKAVNP